MRVLVYVDSPAMVSSGSAIGRALRNELEAEILMLVVDSARHRDVLPKDFTIHDFGELFWPGTDLIRKRRSSIQRLRRILERVLLSPFLLGAKLLGDGRRAWLATARRVGLRKRFRVITPVARRVFNGLLGNIRGAMAGFHRHVTSPIRRFLRRFPAVRRIRALLFTPIDLRVLGWLLSRVRKGTQASRRHVFTPIDLRVLSQLLGRIRGAVAGYHRSITDSIGRLVMKFRVVREFRAIQTTRRYRRAIRKFLRRVKPDVIIVFEDNIETLTRILIATGEEMGTPSAVVPYTIPNPLEPAISLVTNPEHRSGPWTEKAISLFSRSQWVFEFEGKRLLRLPPARVLALEALGLSVPNPWILNSGSARAIALDSERARHAYLDLGFPSAQLDVVGEPVGEQLFEGLSNRAPLRKRLAEENGFDSSDRPLLVCAFPPNQYRGAETRDYELPDFPALVDTWMKSLLAVSQHANILVRPHPRLNADLLAPYAVDRIRITWRPTAELVPAADLYVASISATIRWAIACGVPVVNYDCYRYRYNDYKEALGVLTVFSDDDFRGTVLRFFGDATFAEAMRNRQNAVRRDWGVIDAGFPKRFSALVSRITRVRTPSVSAAR